MASLENSHKVDFVSNRLHTNSAKWSNSQLEEGYSPKDGFIAMSMADSEYEVPSFIIDGIKKRLNHKIFGYDDIDKSIYKSILKWFKIRHDWNIKEEWIVFSPGVTAGIGGVIKSLTSIGDKIVVNSPYYPAFRKIIESNNREFVECPLNYINKTYTFDFNDFRKKLVGAKTFLLCSPHNPTGRVWSKSELKEILEICCENHVLVISDEIHSDIVYSGSNFTPFLSISDKARENGVSLFAPSKTFNIAGLRTSFIIVPEEIKRRKVIECLRINHIHKCNTLGLFALQSAFSNGSEWVDELIEYLEINRNYAVNFINTNFKNIVCIKPESTYLIWLDLTKTGLSNTQLMKQFIEVAGVIPMNGIEFGENYKQFMRLNISCPHEQLIIALDRLKKVFN